MSSLALCIPAYNAAHLLPKLLTSANEQAIPFDEILVYNDCSTDNTSEVAKHYGARVVEGKVNQGCSIGKNRLAQVATSNWLHFHDADDDLLPNFSIVAQRWMKNGNAADIVLLHYHYVVHENNHFISEPKYDVAAMKADPVRFSITDKLVNFALIKRDPFLKIGGFNTNADVLYNEDRAFYTKAVINGLSLDYEPELTCINYYHDSSMSGGNRAKCAKAALHVWKFVIEKTASKYSKEIAEQLLANAASAASALDWPTANESVKIARSIYSKANPGGSTLFKILYAISPTNAYRWREWLLRNVLKKR